MFRDDRDFALREGRDVDSFLSAEIEDSNGGHFVGSSGANGRRLQSWSPGEVSSLRKVIFIVNYHLSKYHALEPPFSFQFSDFHDIVILMFTISSLLQTYAGHGRMGSTICDV